EPIDEGSERQAILLPTGEQQIPAALPGSHEPYQRQRKDQGHIATLGNLQGVGRKEDEIDQEEEPEHGDRRRAGPAESPPEHDRRQDAGAKKGSSHRDAVSGGE